MAVNAVAQPTCSPLNLMRDTPKNISVGTAGDAGNMTLVALFLTKLLPSQRMFPELNGTCPVVELRLQNCISIKQRQ